MIIRHLNIKNFGTINDRTLEFSPGINVLYGENESERTTIHTYIKGMFFKDISEQIGAKFNGMESAVGKDIFTYDDAITRYQLALITTMVKKAKSSERAYTCLKYAWVLRGKRQYLAARPEGIKPEENRSLYMDERECLKNAYEGFLKAISSEAFPMAGMDENTLQYLLADLARRLGKNEDALRLLSMVITSRSASSRMKDEALKLKDMIRESIKNNK